MGCGADDGWGCGDDDWGAATTNGARVACDWRACGARVARVWRVCKNHTNRAECDVGEIVDFLCVFYEWRGDAFG